MSPHQVSTRMQEKLAILQLLKHREPILLIVGQTISGFGDGVALGVLSSHVGVRTYFVVTALITSLPGLYILTSRRVNAIDRERVT